MAITYNAMCVFIWDASTGPGPTYSALDNFVDMYAALMHLGWLSPRVLICVATSVGDEKIPWVSRWFSLRNHVLRARFPDAHHPIWGLLHSIERKPISFSYPKFISALRPNADEHAVIVAGSLALLEYDEILLHYRAIKPTDIVWVTSSCMYGTLRSGSHKLYIPAQLPPGRGTSGISTQRIVYFVAASRWGFGHLQHIVDFIRFIITELNKEAMGIKYFPFWVTESGAPVPPRGSIPDIQISEPDFSLNESISANDIVIAEGVGTLGVAIALGAIAWKIGPSIKRSKWLEESTCYLGAPNINYCAEIWAVDSGSRPPFGRLKPFAESYRIVSRICEESRALRVSMPLTDALTSIVPREP